MGKDQETTDLLILNCNHCQCRVYNLSLPKNCQVTWVPWENIIQALCQRLNLSILACSYEFMILMSLEKVTSQNKEAGGRTGHSQTGNKSRTSKMGSWLGNWDITLGPPIDQWHVQYNKLIFANICYWQFSGYNLVGGDNGGVVVTGGGVIRQYHMSRLHVGGPIW